MNKKSLFVLIPLLIGASSARPATSLSDRLIQSKIYMNYAGVCAITAYITLMAVAIFSEQLRNYYYAKDRVKYDQENAAQIALNKEIALAKAQAAKLALDKEIKAGNYKAATEIKTYY